jgi:outer membrane protein assembly factor BamB
MLLKPACNEGRVTITVASSTIIATLGSYLAPVLRKVILLATILSAATGVVRAQPSNSYRPSPSAEETRQGYSNQRLLAKPSAGATESELTAIETRDGVRLRHASHHDGQLRVLEAATDETILQTAERLRATGRYEFVEPDFLVKAAAAPNDPHYLAADQWALRNIGQSNGTAGADVHAEDAWDIQSSAANVVVAIIDSGIRRTHEDLAANLWVNPNEAANGRDDDGNGYIDDLNGINALVAASTIGNGTPSDADGHGTAVASVIGAVGNNGIGMTGVAWKVKLMALRFLDEDGYGYTSDEIECIDYAIAKGAHVINASFGGSSYSQSLLSALQRARDAGIIVVCAAGNDAENADINAHYPSGYLLDNLVAVANTTRNDVLSSSSSYGPGMIELGAPGTSILTAANTGDRDYQFLSGTSFSAPTVTGAIALLKAKFPKDTYRDTINRLLRSVDQKTSLIGKTSTGGRLNVAAALRSSTNRPFNDDFVQRAVFVGETGTARSAVQSSTREAGEPVHAGVAGNGSLWWTWTAPRSGSVTIDTSASAFDTLLAVYTGSALNALTLVIGNDDESSSVTTSKVTFNATAGTSYQIAVDTKSGTGLVALRFSLMASNDAFDSAQVVSGRSWSVRSDNRSATREPNEPRIKNNAGGHSVWYKWTAPATHRYHLASMSSDFNTMVGVFTGTSAASLAEISASTTGGDSNAMLNSAAVTFTATAGTTYYIVIDSEVSTAGTSTVGDFWLSCTDSDWEFFGYGDPTTVAIAGDGTLHFTDTYGYLYALNPDGSRKWRYAMTGYGTYSSPAVAANGTVYVGDDLGYVHAVNPDGTRKWRTSVQSTVQSSPAVATDGTIYVRSDANRLHALDSDGAVKWSFNMGTSSYTTYSSPVIASDGTIYCAGADSKLYALTPTGTLKWAFQTDFIYASPAIGSDGTIYFGVVAPTRRFYALRPDGTLKWEYIVGDTMSSSPSIGLDGTLYVGCADKKLYAISPSGELRWTVETGGAIRNSSPVIASDGTIYVGCLDGKIYAVDSNGTVRRTYATAGEVRASPMLHNGRLYASSYDYRLYSFDTGQVPASTAWPMHRQNTHRSARTESQTLAIIVQPRAQSAEVGDTVTFSVGAVGSPSLTYQWFFNGQTVAGATNATYRVDPVIHAKGGQYSVRVTDPSGSATSNMTALTVTTPLIAPSIFTAPVAQTVLAGEDVKLSVAATGTTPMTYQWFRDGTAIAGATASTYSLNQARPADSGSYTVALTNFAGTLTSSAVAVTINPITRITNLSIRSQVGASAGTLTVGVTVGGYGTKGMKPLLLRAAGPTLTAFGVPGALTDPRLAILTSPTTIVAQNDDWAGNDQVRTASTAVGAFAFASEASKDSALIYSTESRGYTVQITGADSSSGVALAEVYDTTPSDTFAVSTPRLTNVSALTQVGIGGDILIAGFAITGNTPKTVLIRGIGPTLVAFGVGGALTDPKLELYQGGTTPLFANDNWGAAPNAAQIAAASINVGAFALASDSKDAVLLVTLPPGSYTAQVSGVNSATGVALVEIYEAP